MRGAIPPLPLYVFTVWFLVKHRDKFTFTSTCTTMYQFSFVTVQKVKGNGCETWSLILTEEHRLTVFENRVLRRIFGPKREEDGSWRKLHNDELHSLYSSPNIVRVIKSWRMRCAGHVGRMEEGRGVYRVLVGRSEDKRPLGRPRRMWEDNIKLDLREIGIDRANWILLAQDRVQWRACMNTAMNLRDQ
jgi:hypothetical protein